MIHKVALLLGGKKKAYILSTPIQKIGLKLDLFL